MDKARWSPLHCCINLVLNPRSLSRHIRYIGSKDRLPRTLHHGSGKFIKSILYAPTDVGPAGISQLIARPDLLRHLPRALQDRLRKRSVRQTGARWLVNRLHGVSICLGRLVVRVDAVGRQVRVHLSDGSESTVDHVLLGTGYRVDVSSMAFFPRGSFKSIRQFKSYPCLRTGLETSVPGLHVLGAPAAWSFGPLMQFVSGARYAAQSLTRHVTANTFIVKKQGV